MCWQTLGIESTSFDLLRLLKSIPALRGQKRICRTIGINHGLQGLDALGEGRVSQIGFLHAEWFLFVDHVGSHFRLPHTKQLMSLQSGVLSSQALQ
jgi:hypothetical protein